MTAKKILIDSDVCLDFITGRQPFTIAAQEMFAKIEGKNIEGLVSPHSFSNMFYILNRSYEASTIIKELKKLRTLITVGRLTGNEIDLALNAGWKDFEDAIQYHCAKENGCDAIITRNAADYKTSNLQVLSPSEFLTLLHSGEEE